MFFLFFLSFSLFDLYYVLILIHTLFSFAFCFKCFILVCYLLIYIFVGVPYLKQTRLICSENPLIYGMNTGIFLALSLSAVT